MFLILFVDVDTYHTTTPILHYNMHTEPNLGTNKITAGLMPSIPPKPHVYIIYKEGKGIINVQTLIVFLVSWE
jgi:hypothetical protein